MILYIFFFLLLAAALFCTIQISIHDFKQRIIPDIYLFPLMLIGLTLISFFQYPITIQDATIGAVFGYTTATVIGIIFEKHIQKNTATETPIGMGDIKLIGVGGLWLGTTGLAIALIIACITGAMWAHAKKSRFIPFAPFFLLGGFLSLIGICFLL